MRVLYLHGTFVPPPTDPNLDRFLWLSEHLEGDVLQDVWLRSPHDVERQFGQGSYPVYVSGRFRYHFLPGSCYRGLRGRVALAWFFLSQGLRIHRERPYDCVVTYSHTIAGVCGAILKRLTGAKLIVEIITAPDTVYASKTSSPGLRARIMKAYSDICLHICVGSCDRVHLLAPRLLASYKRLQNVPASIFFEGVPVSQIARHGNGPEQYVLLVGAPWRLKGADVMVKAFLKVAADFPEVKLRLLGHYPDREQLDALIGGSPQIEVLKPRPNPEVLQIMSEATVFALPSRCEGVPRVILEAMGAGVPVVASDVGGIPTVVRDGENGFLVPVNDVDALAARLRQLLSDGELREKMGARAYELAHTEFSEKAYAEHFARMVEATVGVAAEKAMARADE